MMLLRDYCASINRRYEDNVLFGRHLDYFISTYGFAPRTIADNIQTAFSEGIMVEYSSPSSDNSMRMGLIKRLMNNIPARKKLLEMQKGYFAETDGEDKVLYAGFSKESALSYIENFEKYLDDNKDSIEALRIIYNSEDIVITNSMLTELRDRLLSENRQYGVYQIWKNYKLIDEEGNVEELDKKTNVRALTNLIQIVRYAYGKNQKLTSLINGYARRFALYCGQNQRVLTEEQKNIMQRVAEYIIDAGAISIGELNEIDTDLWRKAVTNFDTQKLKEEMIILSKFLLNIKVA
jgi:type I restriction enzyme R subunit